MKARELGALLLLGSIWGASYLFIKVAVQVFPPLTLVTLRVVMAALTSLLILRLRGISLPRSRAMWGTFLVMGLFNGAVPYSLITTPANPPH
ncbi:MAG: EamA family transporter [Anaerolineae bacterium]